MLAPEKPPFGQACNGCGHCCIAEQCQVSIELFGATQLCPALEHESDRFWCGLMRNPLSYGAGVEGLEVLGEEAIALYWRNYIGAGSGCDSEGEGGDRNASI